MTMAPGISLPQELRIYKVEGSDNKGNISVKKANSAGPDEYTLYRQYGTHKATKKQKVWNSNGFQGLCPPCYDFALFLEEDIVLAPHGNTRRSCKRPYITESTTLSRIQKDCSDMVRSLVQVMACWRVTQHHLNHQTQSKCTMHGLLHQISSEILTRMKYFSYYD